MLTLAIIVIVGLACTFGGAVIQKKWGILGDSPITK